MSCFVGRLKGGYQAGTMGHRNLLIDCLSYLLTWF